MRVATALTSRAWPAPSDDGGPGKHIEKDRRPEHLTGPPHGGRRQPEWSARPTPAPATPGIATATAATARSTGAARSSDWIGRRASPTIRGATHCAAPAGRSSRPAPSPYELSRYSSSRRWSAASVNPVPTSPT